jgi:hypothetical protein
MPNIHSRLMCVGACLALAAGCSARNGLFTSFVGSDERDKVPVSKIVAVWEASEGRDMKGSPCRGMAGQISFYKPGQAAPVPVDGKVMIYVFDDQGTKAELAKPIHKFVFDSQSWNRHLRETQLGPTYHVFIPYTRKVVHQVETGLAVRFHPTKPNMPGAASDLVALTLPGPKRRDEGRVKIDVVSEPAHRRKMNVSTFKPGEYLNAAKAAPSTASTGSDSAAKPRSGAKFHDFDLAPRRTQVQSLGPVRPPLAASPTTSPDDLRARQHEQLRSLLAGFENQPAKTQPLNNTESDDRRGYAADSQRSFRLRPAPGAASRGVVTGGNQQQAAGDAGHPLAHDSASRPPRRDDNVRPSLHTAPANPPARVLLEGDAGAGSETWDALSPRSRGGLGNAADHPLVDDQAARREN